VSTGWSVNLAHAMQKAERTKTAASTCTPAWRGNHQRLPVKPRGARAAMIPTGMRSMVASAPHTACATTAERGEIRMPYSLSSSGSAPAAAAVGFGYAYPVVVVGSSYGP
jgi:hypothetical protein